MGKLRHKPPPAWQWLHAARAAQGWPRSVSQVLGAAPNPWSILPRLCRELLGVTWWWWERPGLPLCLCHVPTRLCRCPWEGNTSGFGASRVQGGERSCTEAAGIAEPSPGQLRPGGAGLCSSGEEEQRTLSCQRSRCRQGSGFGSGGSGFGEPHGEGRLAQGCGAGCEGGRGQALCPQLWGRAVTRDAGRRGLEGDSGEGLSGPCTVPAHPPCQAGASPGTEIPLRALPGAHPSEGPTPGCPVPLALGTQPSPADAQHVRSTLSPPPGSAGPHGHQALQPSAPGLPGCSAGVTALPRLASLNTK